METETDIYICLYFCMFVCLYVCVCVCSFQLRLHVKSTSTPIVPQVGCYRVGYGEKSSSEGPAQSRHAACVQGVCVGVREGPREGAGTGICPYGKTGLQCQTYRRRRG